MSPKSDVSEQKIQKRHTNNRAGKKTHPECEIETFDVELDDPEFEPEQARYMCTCDAVRYSMVPMRFIKTIYKVKKYVQNGKIFKGSVLATPLLPPPNTHPLLLQVWRSCAIFMECRLKMRWNTSAHTASI